MHLAQKLLTGDQDSYRYCVRITQALYTPFPYTLYILYTPYPLYLRRALLAVDGDPFQAHNTYGRGPVRYIRAELYEYRYNYNNHSTRKGN